MLNDGEIVEVLELLDTHVAIELNRDSKVSNCWIFEQRSSWAGITKKWKRRTDNGSIIYPSGDNDADSHITLYHRLEKNRKKAIKNEVLELTLWHENSSDKEFWKIVNDQLDNKIEGRSYNLPPSVSLTGRSGSILSATYNIYVAEHNDFFDAYIVALRDAFVDLAVKNYELTTLIDEAFEESIEEYY